LDIDPEIVQEFIAGHMTLAMTNRYIKHHPWHVREKIIDAIVNGHFKTAMEIFAEKVAKGESLKEALVSVPRLREHIQDLPEDFASFAVVEGGICIMGGKGDPCDEGGVYERDADKKDETETYFGPVRGGCGNCRHFRSTPFHIEEMALYIDILMAELRALARQRKIIRTKITDIKCEIDDCEDADKKIRLTSDLNLHEARLESLNHNMVPAIYEWFNRYRVLMECQAQKLALDEGQPLTLVSPFGGNGLTPKDMEVEPEETTDIALTARIIEKARVLENVGIPIPEDNARILEQSVDLFLRMNGSVSLLMDVTSNKDRARGASMIFNALESLVGAKRMQKSLDKREPLCLPGAEKDAINNLATAVVEAANKGELTYNSVCSVVNDNTLLMQ
jgi:hypothetical protein